MDRSRPYLFPLTSLLVAAVIIAALSSGSDAFSQSAATIIAIAKMDVGKAPTGFKFTRTGQGGLGQWTVVSDATASAGRVIEQSSADRTDYRFPLAIFDAVVAKNIEVSVRFKPVA